LGSGDSIETETQNEIPAFSGCLRGFLVVNLILAPTTSTSVAGNHRRTRRNTDHPESSGTGVRSRCDFPRRRVGYQIRGGKGRANIQIRAFDKYGGYLRSIGRKGQGPGEFQFPVQILVSPQQELVVCDLMQRRVLFFSLDGTFKRSVPTWRQGTLTRLLVDSEGDIIAELVLRGEKRGTALMKFDSSFNELFTVAFKERKKLPLLEDISPRIVWSVSVNDEIIWGDSDEYEINVLSQEGMILKKILKSFKPEKIVEANYREAIKSKFGEKPIPLDFEQRLPEYYPAFRFIGTDNEGRIFVSTYEKANDGHGYTVDVFSRESEYIARISLKTQPRICKERKLYTVEEDEKGYPVLKRYGTKWKIDAHGS
jgi:hypothetical protein